MRMMKISLLLIAICVMCSCTIIPPGEVGIKINRLGDNRGVDQLPLTTGLVTYVPGLTTVVKYPTFVQTARWEKHDKDKQNNEIVFNTKDGMIVSADVSLSYQIVQSKVPAFYIKFRTDDLDLFTHGFLFNVARDAFNEVASNYSVEDIYGAKKEEYLTTVRKRVNDQLFKYGIDIQQFGFLGKIRVPSAVETAINAKIQATQDAQRVENQIREAKAEAEKKIANAIGISKSNQLLANSITPQLIQWEQMQIQKAQITKWDGKLPYMMPGNQSAFLFNIPQNK